MVEQEYLLKICVLCCPDELLTPSLCSYADRTPNSSTRSSLGVLAPFPTKQITANNNNIKLILDDISTKEFFDKLRPTYFRGASAAVFAFSKADRTFFKSAIKHYHEFRTHIPDLAVPVAFIGLRADSEVVPQVEGQSLAQECGATYFEMAVDDLSTFDAVVRSLVQQVLTHKGQSV
ncbi:MAG: hypothetical protein ACFFB5_23350 [Promethearchaeota archaeon]